MDKLRLAMLISGGGTTAREIIRAARDGRLPRMEPALLISSRRTSGGIAKALAEGMKAEDITIRRPKDYPNPEAFGEAIIADCRERGVDLIGQYGWLPITPANVIEEYGGLMVNQHPGPLDPGRPDFGGMGMFGRRVHCARLYFVRVVGLGYFTEATAHRVYPDVDKGPVLRRRVVEIKDSDDVTSLQERVLPEEHLVQIETLDDFANDRVTELTRERPLVYPDEEEVLREAKRIASIRFPKG